jgi:hypothetical protein
MGLGRCAGSEESAGLVDVNFFNLRKCGVNERSSDVSLNRLEPENA